MELYVGTKILEATEKTLGEYNTFRGWEMPADEDPATPGYLVRYDNGHVSWSPKNVFETSYINLGVVDGTIEPHVVRMLGELAVLHDNFIKLRNFIGTERYVVLSGAEKVDMGVQHKAMQTHLEMLRRRILRRLPGDSSHVQRLLQLDLALPFEMSASA